MLTISRLHKGSIDRTTVENLYLTAFPEIERHPIGNLYDACDTGRCEWLVFKDGKAFVGMAYMIINDGIAFLLYLAVDEEQRNKAYGAQILSELSREYDGMEVILLIESLQEECDNMDIRIRRKGFYLRNGFYDTEYIQSTCEGAAIYDILSTSKEFSTDKWKTFVANYPMESYMDNLYRAINQDTIETERLLLRRWKLSDAGALYKYARDPEVGPHAGWPPHQSIEESKMIIREVFTNDYTWAVVLKETNEPIGCMGYYPFGKSNIEIGENDAEIGYWIGKPHWNKGFCTEALESMIRYCYEKKNFETLWSDFFIDNPASGKVMEKCGFTDTGKENYCSNLYHGEDRPVHIMKLEKKL